MDQNCVNTYQISLNEANRRLFIHSLGPLDRRGFSLFDLFKVLLQTCQLLGDGVCPYVYSSQT